MFNISPFLYERVRMLKLVSRKAIGKERLEINIEIFTYFSISLRINKMYKSNLPK